MAINGNSTNGLLTFSAILILLMVAVPQTLGLGRGGFDSEEILKIFFFYSAPGIGFLLGLLLLEFIERKITAGDAKYGSGLGFWSTGDKPGFRIPLIENPVALLLLSAIFFGAIGLASFTYAPQQTYTGVGQLQQQFTPLDNLLFSIFQVVPSENLGAGFILAFIIFTTRAIARKYNWNSWNFRLTVLLIAFLLVGFYGLANHELRYQGSDTARTTVFFFWGLGGLMSAAVGNAIPFLFMHGANNFFFAVKPLFSSDATVGLSILGIVGMAGVYWYFFHRRGSR